MSTTKQKQYDRLRKLLNPAIRGKNTDAVLWALANPSAHLVNTVESVGDQVYIASASGRYLDQRLADYNVVRPPQVGLDDDIFRNLGIEIVNRKQVRDLMMTILTTIFGEELTQATSRSNFFEPYNLDDGDVLKIKFDGAETVDVTFEASQFANINTASAQEVSDAITRSLRSQGKTGRAFAKDDGAGFYVTIISDTEGPQSSVAVLGGRAQNVLNFDKIRPTTGAASTQWTVSINGGLLRYTWTGGANPSVGKARPQDYVNIYASGFDSKNIGTYTVVNIKSGTVGNAYFEISNPNGVAEIVSQGTTDGVLFYQPTRKTITSRSRYAAVFQEESNILQVFIPATTKVVRRDRQGAAHIHEPVLTSESFTPGKNSINDITFPSPVGISDGAYFLINSAQNADLYYVYLDKTGNNLVDPAVSGRTGIRVNISGTLTDIDVAARVSDTLNLTGKFTSIIPTTSILRLSNAAIGVTALPTNGNIVGLLISNFQLGTDDVSTSTSTPNPVELIPDQQGPYTYDLQQNFVLSEISTTNSSLIDSSSGRIINAIDSSQFPDDQGHIILSYGTDRQEGPIPYLSRPSSTTLLLNPAYNVSNIHQPGSEIRLVSQLGPVSVSQNGADYPFYLTDVVSGRIYAEELINEVAAAGVTVVITILYPGSEGLGKWSTPDDEKVIIWGDDDYV